MIEMHKSTINIVRVQGDEFAFTEDIVVREVPVTVVLNGEELVTMVCSPQGIEELTAGFLCSEGLLYSLDDLKSIEVDSELGVVRVEAAASEDQAQGRFLKRYITSCCGRGRPVFYFVNDAKNMNMVSGNVQVTPGQVYELSKRLEEMSALFQQTGGVHNAALCSPSEVLLFYEDVGRHNAVDKLFGKAFLTEMMLEDKILVFSGRISSEIIIKVGKMGVPIIISRSAPTALGIEMATKIGVTIIGFAKENRMNIYTYPERVIGKK